ncbi:cation:proton antiporter [bacterium]|nr:MAG: cation:proton antiporter [bacterium]
MLNPILSLGLLVIAGFIFGRIFNKMGLPSVTGYIVSGIVMGPYGLNIIHKGILNGSDFVSSVALSFIAYTLGKSFTLKSLRKIGKAVFAISIGEVVVSFLVVTLALKFILHQPLYLSIVIGAIAPATAPAAVVMVVREYRAKGPLTDTLLGVVAIDDAWGIMLFAFSIALARALSMSKGIIFSSVFHQMGHAFIEVVGSLGIGFIIGYIFSKLFKFFKSPTHTLIGIIGVILLTGGICEELKLSILLSNMMLGTTIANTIKPSTRAFDILEGFDPPLYLLFFVLAGASLEVTSLKALGLIGLVYVFTRLPGEMLGAYIGARISKAPPNVRKYLGLGLAPQAGVAIGLAIISKIYLPEGDLILSTIIVTTVIYELIGPPLVKLALRKAKEI